MISSFLLKEQIFAILWMIIPYIVVKMTLNYIGGSKIWHGHFIKMVQRIFFFFFFFYQGKKEYSMKANPKKFQFMIFGKMLTQPIILNINQINKSKN